jgi:hypothetical protein
VRKETKKRTAEAAIEPLQIELGALVALSTPEVKNSMAQFNECVAKVEKQRMERRMERKRKWKAHFNTNPRSTWRRFEWCCFQGRLDDT